MDANNKTVNPSVDVVSTMDDLSMFADGSAAAVYASHVLEHGSYAQPRIEVVLRRTAWNSVWLTVGQFSH